MIDFPTVVFLDPVHPLLEELLKKKKIHCIHDYQCLPQDLSAKYPKINGIVIRSRFFLDKATISSIKQLKFIARFGAGMENIDVDFAQSKGIKCLHAPEGNMDAVGEHALGMLLSLFNNLNRADKEVRMGVWKREENRGIELKGKTVAILGYGNMGKSFAKKLLGFETKILVHDLFKKNYLPKSSKIKESSLNEIFEKADVLSIHINFLPQNLHYINEAFINKFAKPIYIINTSRGKVLNTKDLLTALENKKVLGACLDVLEFESVSFEKIAEAPETLQKLFKRNEVILSPHIAGWSMESNRKMAEILAKKIEISLIN